MRQSYNCDARPESVQPGHLHLIQVCPLKPRKAMRRVRCTPTCQPYARIAGMIYTDNLPALVGGGVHDEAVELFGHLDLARQA